MSLFPGKGSRDKKGRKQSADKSASADKESLRGAERQTTGLLSFGYLLDLHRHMAIEAFRRLLKAPVASFMNCLMIALAFTLPALFYLLVNNIQVLAEGWDGNPKISLYLSTETSVAKVKSLQAEVLKISGNEPVYISPEQGLASFQKHVGISDVVSELGFNPLPGVLQLNAPAGISYNVLGQMVDQLQALPGVEQVRLDKKWVQRLLAITGFLEQISIVLALLLGVTVWLAISNTVGLSIEARKQEITVVKLVGGTDGFIMLPFLYTGMLYGLFGALLAVMITWGTLIALIPSVMSLAGLYSQSFKLTEPGWQMFFALIGSGALLGILGASASCFKHLKKLEPC